MDRFKVSGGARLVGDVVITGAKNSVLKLMAVTLMAPGTYRIGNVPDIADVTMMSELLTRLDCNVSQDRKSTRLNSSHVSESRMPSSA